MNLWLSTRVALVLMMGGTGGWDVEYYCPDGALIPRERACDGREDCDGGADEKECFVPEGVRRWGGARVLWQCVDGDYIDEAFLCDSIQHCGDGSDEYDATCRAHSCSADKWRCTTTGACVRRQLVCDGNADCRDGSDEDEDLCAHFPCDYFRCKGEAKKSAVRSLKQLPVVRCLDETQVCDGKPDCPGGDDEDAKFCQMALTNVSCPALEFRCPTSPKCLNLNGMCEVTGCNSTVMKLCGRSFCQPEESHFFCHVAMCIPKNWICHYRGFPCDAGYNFSPASQRLRGRKETKKVTQITYT